MTYAQVKERLEEIEADLAERQVEYEAVAEARLRQVREWEYVWAKVYAATDKDAKVDDRKYDTLLTIAVKNPGLRQEWIDAEARYDALKAAIKVLESRASIGQSLLRSLVQEGDRPQPAWSNSQ